MRRLRFGSSPLRSVAIAALLGVGGLAARASAQAGLSTQGFGFPTGQLSSRALGTGGSIGEIDPLSPINPASIAVLQTRVLYFQAEPEFRTVSTPNGDDHTTTARYPNVFGAIPVAGGFTVSLGASTLLDRTSTTIFAQPQFFGPGDSVIMTTKFAIQGAINDVRLAGAWSPKSWFRIGVGLHGITGHNLVTVQQTFSDTVAFAIAQQQRILSFSGTAASLGVQLLAKDFTLAASARQGGSLSMSAADTILTRAHVPNRFGASLTYTGIANSFISVRTSRDDWAAMGGLGTPSLRGVNGWDSSIGADFAGPKLGSRPLFFRGGFRDRTLPFTADANTVTEKSVTGGVGTMFANGRMLSDLAVVYANRSADLSASEHAWTISIGVSVRP
jgi:hypothetical protein